MAESHPPPISKAQEKARHKRVSQIARRLGFVGRVEYRVYTQAGGAQYGLAVAPEHDLLIDSAEAFEPDADPADSSLKAIIAHETGHQLLARHEVLTRNLPCEWSGVSEEIAASLLGSLLVRNSKDERDLLLKALFDAGQHGLTPDEATGLITELRAVLEKLL